MNWTFFIDQSDTNGIIFPENNKIQPYGYWQYNHMVEFIGNLRYNTKGIVLSFSL